MTVPDSETKSSGSRTSPEHTGFRPDIEGLRGVAVLAVVLFHCSAPGVGGGFVGVDVFFVISGFLITGLLWREAATAGTVRLSRFYGARARRLLPASALVGVVTAIASAILLSPLEVKPVLIDGIASALYVGNYQFARQGVDYFHISKNTISPFQHYWSLGVEEQFYLVWPALIIATAWLVRRARRRDSAARATPSASAYLFVLALVGAVSFAFSLVATSESPPVAFFSLHTRAWELAVGGIVALTTTYWRRLPVFAAAMTGWAGLVLVLLACNHVDATTPYPGTAALLPVLGTALVIGAGCGSTSLGCGRVLASRPMRAVGRVSYSWYLWHWPVLLLATPLLGRPMGPIDGLAAVAVSLGLAVLTLHLVENPFRYSASFRRSAGRSLALGGAATALAVCAGVALLVVVPTPVGHGPAAQALRVTADPPTGSNVELYDAAVQRVFAQVQAAVAASVDMKAVPSNLDPPLVEVANEKTPAGLGGCLRNLLEVHQPECATGDKASGTTVALVGDSNAFSWGPAFQQAAEQRHWRLEVLTKGACPMLDLPLKIFVQRKYTECEQWRSQIVARLRDERPRLVVVSMLRHDSGSGSPPYGPGWIDSVTRMVQELRGTGAAVLVLGPTPDLHSMVPDCLSLHLEDAAACSSATSTAVNKSGVAGETAATNAGGGRYADVTELFCTAENCPPIVGNTLVYEDEFHITPEYARVLAPAVDALVSRSLISG
ncbi:acyltransferase [Mycobacterium scrofulaceum]|nr:acyltransferase [Mycobacterium scrofulaceum]